MMKKKKKYLIALQPLIPEKSLDYYTNLKTKKNCNDSIN